MMSRKWINILATAIGLALLGLSAWYLYRIFQNVNWSAVGYQLTHTAIWRLAAAAALTVIGYLIIAGYDWLGLRYIGRPQGPRRTLLAGVTSGAFSNSIAVPILNVGGMRFRFYTAWGVPEGAIARLIAFVGLGSWMGLLLFCGAVFVFVPPRLPFAPAASEPAVRALGGAFLLTVAAYLTACSVWKTVRFWKWRAPLPSPRLAAAQVAVGVGDWLVQAMIVYVLLAGVSGVGLGEFLAAYLAAMFAAMIGRSGGGFGIFEAGALYLLGPGMQAERLVAVLILYRVIYHFSPLLIAMLAYVAFEAYTRLTRIAAHPQTEPDDGMELSGNAELPSMNKR